MPQSWTNRLKSAGNDVSADMFSRQVTLLISLATIGDSLKEAMPRLEDLIKSRDNKKIGDGLEIAATMCDRLAAGCAAGDMEKHFGIVFKTLAEQLRMEAVKYGRPILQR